MSYLEQLRRDAEKGREEKAAREAEEQRRKAIYQEELRPRVLAIHQFLIDLIKQLEDARWRVELHYQVPAIGAVPLLQSGYRVNVDSTENPREITLSALCTADEPARYAIAPEQEAELRAFLGAHRVRCEMWPDRQPKGRRVLICEVRLALTSTVFFRADVENARIVVETRDFSAPGTDEYAFPVSQPLDEPWLDDLAGFLLRKSATLRTLPQPPARGLSADEREALERRLIEARLRDEAARQRELEPASRAPEPSLGERLRSMIRRVRE